MGNEQASLNGHNWPDRAQAADGPLAIPRALQTFQCPIVHLDRRAQVGEVHRERLLLIRGRREGFEDEEDLLIVHMGEVRMFSICGEGRRS